MQNCRRSKALQEKTIKISCVVPVFNEEGLIDSFCKELYLCLKNITPNFEIIIVDDGSTDHTVEKILQIANEYQIKLLQFSRNFGKEIALTAGLEHISGDVAILLDADFQHPIEVIPLFLKEWENGHDMVYGVRKNRHKESFVKRNFAHFFYWLMQKITHVEIPRNAGDFRLIDKKIVSILASFSERSRFMKGLYAWVGFKTCAVPFDVKERAVGKSQWRFSRLTELALTGITSFSDIPLRVWGLIGFFISLIALIYAIYIVGVTLLYGADLPGFPTIVVAIMFLGGIQLLSIGILGEYIAKIFTEVKQRPKYILKEKLGFEE